MTTLGGTSAIVTPILVHPTMALYAAPITRPITNGRCYGFVQGSYFISIFCLYI